MGWERDNQRAVTDTRTDRTRRAEWSTDVAVPAGQSLLIAVGVAVGALVVAMALAIWQNWRWWAPFALSGALGGLSFAVAAVLLTLDHRKLLWAAERTLQVDLDGDRAVGEPQEVEPLRVEVLEDHGNRARLSFVDLPCKDRLPTLARGVLNGRGTGQASWTGAGNPFSRSEYQAIRAALIERGLAAWVNPDAHAQGWELTSAGRAVMRRIARSDDNGRH